MAASVRTMLYARPIEELPNRLTMNRLMRRPSPDFTTACATRNAMTTSRTLGLAKPLNAFAAVTVPVSTTAATAIIVDVSKREGADQHGSDGGHEDREEVPGRRREAGGHGHEPDADRDRERQQATRQHARLEVHCRPSAACPILARPFRPSDWPCTTPSSLSRTKRQENS